MIRVSGVTFGYDGAPVLAGLDLTIPPGGMTALIGPNGSGKTTLLKLMAGALRASTGEIRLDGRPVGAMSPRERARLLAVVPQETSMIFDFTVLETVLMGRTAHLGWLGVEGPEDMAAAEEAMRRTGTLDLASRPITHLSGGERQLVFLARALAQQPRVVLLDEPTAFLDIRHRLEIYRLLSRLNAQEGLTIVTTSHDINLAARFCPRLVLIKDGAIRADGPPERVLVGGILAQVYGTPLDVVTDTATGLRWIVPPDSAPPGGSAPG